MKKKRKSQSEPLPLGSVIDKLLAKYSAERDNELARIWKLWGSLVENQIAMNTKPAALKGKNLIVYASGSVWIHALQFLKKDIIQNINNEIGRDLIEDIKCKVGSVK